MGEAIVAAVGGWWWMLAILVAIVGVGRLTRVATFDKFPPAQWVRQRWTNWVVKHKHDDWHILFFCPWCLSPWLMVVCIGWFMLGFAVVWVAWAWWIFWGWLALSYLVGMLVVRDEPAEPAPREEP